MTFDGSPATQVITRENARNRPVITLTPFGGGRLLLSGALDAWRYRADDSGAFDRFWQALIAGSAMATPPAIDIQVEPAVIASGGHADVRVRVQRTAVGIGPADTVRISSTLSTGESVRLWPDAAVDSFRGSFVAPRPAQVTRINVAVDGAKQGPAFASFIVAPNARVTRPSGPPLSLLADSHGGIDVTPETLSDLERRLRRDVSAPPARVERRPMRSAWWIIPFAGCLSGEWWLRRRRGLR